MKKAAILMITALMSTASFAQDYVKCEFKIKDNEVKCPLLGRCPEKELRDSETKLEVLIHQGETLQGKVTLKEVVLHPGTKKEKKNKVFLFEDDNRHEEIRDEKGVDLFSFESTTSIDYTISKFGDKIDINFITPNYKHDLDLRGRVSYSSYIATPDSAIAFTCDKLNKEVFEEGERKQKALEEHLKSKAEKASHKSSSVTKE
jgi:hypothetical protein